MSAAISWSGELHWIFFGWPDGNFFASHRLGDSGLEMIEIDKAIRAARLVGRNL